MRLATWNVNSLRVRLPQVLEWLSLETPDILALQETKMSDPDFPHEAIEAAGYQAAYSGQKTYNGVAILSRHGIEEPVTDMPQLDDPQRRLLAVTVHDTRIVNLYVPNGSELGSEKFDYKMAWLAAVNDYIRAQLLSYPRLAVMGDFNIAPDDRDVYDPAAWNGRILCSEPEREAFRRLLDNGLSDCFRQLHNGAANFSWWDYRGAAFRRNLGLRIDHILASAELAPHLRDCRIDRSPRGWQRPSDHAPVLAEFH